MVTFELKIIQQSKYKASGSNQINTLGYKKLKASFNKYKLMLLKPLVSTQLKIKLYLLGSK